MPGEPKGSKWSSGRKRWWPEDPRERRRNAVAGATLMVLAAAVLVYHLAYRLSSVLLVTAALAALWLIVTRGKSARVLGRLERTAIAIVLVALILLEAAVALGLY